MRLVSRVQDILLVNFGKIFNKFSNITLFENNLRKLRSILEPFQTEIF